MSGNDTPKVTVCMPVYNNGKYLREAIESVLNQSFTDFELLVCDDNSQDDTADIARSYAALDRRITVTVNEANLGMVANWNRCLRQAKGEYVRYLFGDDLFCSVDALKSLVFILDEDRNVALAASARYLIDEKSARLRTMSNFEDGTVIDGETLINITLCEQRNMIGEPSVVMFRRKHAARGFDGRYRQLVDLEMWLHLLEQGKYAYVGHPLTSFRVHPEQQTRKNVQMLAHLDDMYLLLQDYLEKPYVSASRITKKFLVYNQRYRYWNACKQGALGKREALSRIVARGRLWTFFLGLPLYKIYSPYLKFKNRMIRRSLGRKAVA